MSKSAQVWTVQLLAFPEEKMGGANVWNVVFAFVCMAGE